MTNDNKLASHIASRRGHTSLLRPWLVRVLASVSLLTASACGSFNESALASTELTREQAQGLLASSMPTVQRRMTSRGYSCQPTAALYLNGVGPFSNSDGEVNKPLHQSRHDGQVLQQMEALQRAGIIGPISVEMRCATQSVNHCYRNYSAQNLVMQYDPSSNNGYRGAMARYTCVLPYADLGPPEITGVSNSTPTTAVATWRRPWTINQRAADVGRVVGGIMTCTGCPRAGQYDTGETRFTRFDHGWVVADL